MYSQCEVRVIGAKSPLHRRFSVSVNALLTTVSSGLPQAACMVNRLRPVSIHDAGSTAPGFSPPILRRPESQAESPFRPQRWLSDANCEPLPVLSGWKQNGSVKLDAGAAFLIRRLQVRFLPGLPDCPIGIPRSGHSPCGDQNVESLVSRLRGRAVRRASGDSNRVRALSFLRRN